MSSFGKRSIFLVCIAAVSVPLGVAALAYGCTAVATLTLGPSAAKAGSTVKVTGRFFGTHDPATDNTNGRVELRLGSLSGEVLGTAAPAGSDRSFTTSITIPAGSAAGDTFIAATQKTAAGTNVYGTPTRQAFTVLSASAPAGSTGSAPVNKIAATEPGTIAETLTLAEARRVARMRIKRSNPSAKRIRAKCSRRSRTSATCRVRWTSKGKSRSKKLTVRSQASSSAW